MKPARVEFYVAAHESVTYDAKAFSWRLQASNGQTILTPHEAFDSHRNAIASFKRVCKAMDARGPWQIVDEPGMPTRKSSHEMIVGKKQ